MKTKKYVSFDVARKSGKRMGNEYIESAWFELDELFQYIGDIVFKEKINELLDNGLWLIEGDDYEN